MAALRSEGEPAALPAGVEEWPRLCAGSLRDRVVADGCWAV